VLTLVLQERLDAWQAFKPNPPCATRSADK
jgi:hypothetical protein